MAVFKRGVPVDSPSPVVAVDVDAANPLSVGTHHFQLIVLDDSDPQLQSDPVTVAVVVAPKPVAVITPLPGPVPANTAFKLAGDQSQPAGHIKIWRWTLLD